MPSKGITLKDRIYGTFAIEEPVLIELLKSPSLLRLKNISQFGPPAKYYHLKPFSRFEHSVGVMLLLRHLGARLEEQVAGLLHDISHTAFSHVVDWVVGSNEKENYQDKFHKKFLKDSTIGNILKKYDLNLKRISRYENFQLLEKKLPELCADRLDYSLREFPKDLTRKCFLNLSVQNGRIAFKDRKVAKDFALGFLNRQETHWGAYEAGTRYVNLAKAVKMAIDSKYLSFADLLKDDNHVVSILEKINDGKIKNILRVLKRKDLSGLKTKTIVFKKKFRYVDPLYLDNDNVSRLSEVDVDFKRRIEKAKKENKKGIRLPLIQ